MSWYQPELQSVLAIAVAELDDTGRVMDGNAGFLALVGGSGQDDGGTSAKDCFVQPDFDGLLQMSGGDGGAVYSGILTFRDKGGRTRTLQSRVWRTDGGIRLMAEYDVAEQERLNDLVLEVNQGYADAQLALAQVNFRLQQREAQITELSLTDPLTGVGNRRCMDQALAKEIERAKRGKISFSAFMVDVDHFKRVNDTFGHDVGDKVLQAVGSLLKNESRTNDIVARFGGEEFVVLMPSTDLAQAVVIAERVRQTLASHPMELTKEPVTVSAGVAEFHSGEDPAAFLRRIDLALFEAKTGGRNRVVADQSVHRPSDKIALLSRP